MLDVYTVRGRHRVATARVINADFTDRAEAEQFLRDRWQHFDLTLESYEHGPLPLPDDLDPRPQGRPPHAERHNMPHRGDYAVDRRQGSRWVPISGNVTRRRAEALARRGQEGGLTVRIRQVRHSRAA